MSNNLKLLRKQIKIKLLGLTPQSRTVSSQKITAKIIQSERFIHSQNIACYVPINNEVDTWLLIKKIWDAGKNCYLPAFSPKIKNNLCFIKFIEGDQLVEVEHKILAPKIVPEKMLAPEDLDLVIVPLVGFNRDGYRLGHGAGCYDRTFAFKKHVLVSSLPYLIGVGFECQLVEFEPNPWDIPMNVIVWA